MKYAIYFKGNALYHSVGCAYLECSLSLHNFGPVHSEDAILPMYRKFHCGNEIVVRLSELHDRRSYPVDMISVYWNSTPLPSYHFDTSYWIIVIRNCFFFYEYINILYWSGYFYGWKVENKLWDVSVFIFVFVVMSFAKCVKGFSYFIYQTALILWYVKKISPFHKDNFPCIDSDMGSLALGEGWPFTYCQLASVQVTRN